MEKKYIDSEKLIAEIERLKDKYPSWQLKLVMDDLCSFITSLQQEQKCIFGNTPSEDICSVCSAYCSLRVPKTKVSASTEIATPSGQADELTFEEYLRGCFEINNGIENDTDNLVRIHAPELLKLARKQEQPEVELEEEVKRWKNKHGVVGMDDLWLKFARHFAEWGAIHLNARKEE